MSDITVLRLEVDSDVVRRAAGVVPGVEVPEADAVSEGRFGPVTPFPGDSDDDPAPDDTVETPGRGSQIRSLVSEYGLLGAGVALIGAGVATAGLWWYRRRNRDDEPGYDEPGYEGSGTESWGDTPPPSRSRRASERLDRGVAGREPVPNPDGVPGDDREIGDVAEDREVDDTATADQATDEPTTSTTELAETRATADGDSSEAEATASERDEEATDDGPAGAVDEATETVLDDEAEAGGSDDTDEQHRPEHLLAEGNGSVDRAPLFGVAFLALTGALVRWLRGDGA